MGWFTKDKSGRIRALETAIAKLAAEVVALKAIAEKTQTGVEAVQEVIGATLVQCAECGTRQEGRWEAHGETHDRLSVDLEKLSEIVARNAEDIRILSANISRIADRQRGQ